MVDNITCWKIDSKVQITQQESIISLFDLFLLFFANMNGVEGLAVQILKVQESRRQTCGSMFKMDIRKAK
jgi:hypothetical protein